MKKIIILLMVLGLVACSSKANDNVVAVPPTNSPLQNEDLDHSLDTFEAGDNWHSNNLDYYGLENEFSIKTVVGSDGYLGIDEVYLLKGHHIISFDLLCDEEFESYFEVLDDYDNVIQSYKVTHGNNRIDLKLSNTIYSGKLQFKFINNIDKINISIKNFSINQNKDVIRIHINQVGYQNSHRKVAIFSGTQGNYFVVKRVENDEIVMISPLSEIKKSKHTDEYISQGDFTDLNVDGEYYLESSLGYKSYPFIVANDVYNEIYNDSLTMLTLQRCGQEIPLDFNRFLAHDICHITDTKVQTTAEMIDTRGGWHDAGDYGRYIETATKALSDLLIAYLINPDGFNDDMSHLDSGNDIPDILDEIKYELDWMFKMQRKDGGVYSRAVTKVFADEVLPEDDIDQIYALQVSSASSAGFGSVMSLASVAFRGIDDEYADKCLEAAKLAMKYVKNTGKFNPILPEGFVTGDYALCDEDYYRFYLGVALWYATEDKSYLDFAFEKLDLDELDFYSAYWNPLLVYPTFIYLNNADTSYANYDILYQAFINYVNDLAASNNRDAYRISLNGNYKWGSNQNVADRAMILLMGHHLTNKTELYDAACEHLDYLLGKNTLNYSFVVGYGEQYPKKIHHRITMVKNTEFKGALVGGPNSSLDDPLIKDMYKGVDIGPARVYVDAEDSYSTNEIAIHFNTPLIFIFSYINNS